MRGFFHTVLKCRYAIWYPGAGGMLRINGFYTAMRLVLDGKTLIHMID
jgi:hypothetical protein